MTKTKKLGKSAIAFILLGIVATKAIAVPSVIKDLSGMALRESATRDANDYDVQYGKLVGEGDPNNQAFQCSQNEKRWTSEDEEETTTIAICGGGLAGLALAIGLQQSGIPCKVYERAPRLRSVSQGMLALQPNGLAALKSIHPELPSLVSAAGCEFQQAVFTTIQSAGDDKVIVSQGVNEKSIAKYGYAAILIQWHALQMVLASQLSDEVVVTGRSFASFEEFDDSVLLHFEDGPSVRCQAMLACDGTFSRARGQILSRYGDRPIFFGQLNWNAIIKTSDLPETLRHPPCAVTAIRHEGDDEKALRWFSFLNDCGRNQTFWQLRVTDPEKAMALSGNSGRGGLGLSGIKATLQAVLKPSASMSAALKHSPEEQIFERCIIARAPAATWRSDGGRVALVGDAAHAMHPNIGHGGNSAFESVSAVIEAMKRCEGDWKTGLENYERKRKPRADLVLRYSNMMGCVQSTGDEVLELSVKEAISDWIHLGRPAEMLSLPSDIEKLLLEFDPCSKPQVTYM